MEQHSEEAVIKVIGVGGGGGNAVEHMVKQQIEGVRFIAANTDAQALRNSAAHAGSNKYHICAFKAGTNCFCIFFSRFAAYFWVCTCT